MESPTRSGSGSGSRSKCWVLTVYERQGVAEQPEPLSRFDPKSSGENVESESILGSSPSLLPAPPISDTRSGDGKKRPSPAENGGKEAYLEESDGVTLHAESLRKSPRLASAETGNAGPILKKLYGSGQKLSSRSKTSGDKSTIRSPSFDSLHGTVSGSLDVLSQSQGSNGLHLMQLSDKKELHLNVECSAEKCFGRFHRPSSAQSGSKSNCSSAILQGMSLRNTRSSDKVCFEAVSPSTYNLKKRSPVEFKTKIPSLSWHTEADEESVALKYHHQKKSEHLRRSPRLILGSSNSGTNVSLRNFDIVLLDKKKIRRSPRLSSPLSGVETIKLKSSDEQPPKKIKTSVASPGLRALDEKQLKRAPRSAPDEPPSKKTKTSLGKFDLGMMDGKLLRRFPRTATSQSGNKFDNMNCDSNSVEMRSQTKNTTSASSEKKQKNHKNTSSFVGDPMPSEGTLTMDKKFSRQSSRTASCPVGKFEKTKCSSGKLQESTTEKRSPTKTKTSVSSKNKQKYKIAGFFVGDPIPTSEAQERWHWRYELKSLQSHRSKRQSMTEDNDDDDMVISNVECHYNQAEVNKCTYSLGDCAYIKGDGGEKHIGRIIEFFKTTDGENYFRVQWFYKVEDTVIKEANFHDKKRIFYSTVMNDNLIDCILSKVTIVQRLPKTGLKSNSVPSADFYFDMEYCVEYSTFRNMLPDDSLKSCDQSPTNHIELIPTKATTTAILNNKPSCCTSEGELALLDLYSGCGGMSTGLSLGAKNSGVNLVTRWALDSDTSACESLKLNHPETHVRNEAAEDFLELLKAWEKLYKRYGTYDVNSIRHSRTMGSQAVGDAVSSLSEGEDSADEFEVSSVVDICYGDPDNTGKHGLKLKVRWKGYGPSEDTWEPIEGLSNCQERIQDFVRTGLKSKILPLPGDVDVICGGPPCQGISGYNRFRNTDSPLTDERNRQIIIFMDIVKFLKPKFVLMENVVDILKFDNASLGRYALSRLVSMKYQARLGIMAAGCYGLPQFRLRFFLWGAHPSEKLPQFPLPTHDVIVRYWPPAEFERNTVAYDEDQPRDHLQKALVLQDAISDLPEVTNDEIREEMPYEKLPQTEFQRYIRSSKREMTGSGFLGKPEEVPLYDHRPYVLSEDNYIRVCQIPKRKGANFRDLHGVVVGADNVARRDATKEQIMLPSGKPLVPDFAFTFEQGKSKRPYARLWWDENVPTVVTSPNYRCQAMLHPEQDRILTMREYARLQGFPDYYRFYGNVSERYRQIGNAVAVPVARALGYALGMAFQKLGDNKPLMTLPPKFSYTNNIQYTENHIQKPSGDEPLNTFSLTTSYTNNTQSAENGCQKTEYKPPFVPEPPEFSQSDNSEFGNDGIQKTEDEEAPLRPSEFSQPGNIHLTKITDPES